jgi:ABC-2 type transport system ATP-binding protein
MIEANGIVKRFGRVIAVDHVTFFVPAGAVCGFLGPNGAGKTTTIRMLVGAVAPDAGEVSMAGLRMDAGSSQARRVVGYLPEESPVEPDLTVNEFVGFRAELYGVPRRLRADAVARALARCNVTDVRHRLCGQLSKGYRQRVGLAAAIVHAPRVLVLDEPTSGLDPSQVIDFRALLQDLRAETTILLSSHVLAEVEASCDRAVLIDSGRVVAAGTMAELRTIGAASERLLVECAADGWFACEIDATDGADATVLAEESGRVLVLAGNAVRRLERSAIPLEAIVHRILAGAGSGTSAATAAPPHASSATQSLPGAQP